MTAMRSLLNSRPAWAMLIVLIALLPRVLVPAGYMPGTGSRSFTVMLCNDASGVAMRIAIPMNDPAPAKNSDGRSGDHPCAFGSLADVSLGGADAVLLATALDHILALGFLPVAAPVLQGFFLLRPPLRGPPALS